MLDIKLYYGLVIDNMDPDESGKVQIRLLPEMKDVAVADLPWLRPFMPKAMTEESVSFDPLEVGSPAWCFFMDSDFQYGWYVSGAFVDGFFDYGTVQSDLGNIEELDTQEYPQAKFTRYEDGTIYFHNSKTGETGIYHNTGSYVVFDKDGGLTGYSNKQLHLYTDGNAIRMENQGDVYHDANGTIYLNGDSDSLVKLGWLETILDGLTSLLDNQMHSDPISGTTGTPMPLLISSTTTINKTSPARQNLGTKSIKVDANN